MPGKGHHTAKWDSCVASVQAKNPGANAFAICTAALGPSLLSDDPTANEPFVWNGKGSLGKPFKASATPPRGTIGKPIRKMTDLGRAVLLDMDQMATPAPTPTPMMQVPNPTEVGLINALRALLASSYGMYILAHAAHWNIEGREFASMHDFFGDLYEDVFGAIDPFAEAIRQHGGYAPTSFADTLNANTAMPPMATGGEAVPMLAGLTEANVGVMAGLKATKVAALAAGDDGLANFCDERLAHHLKHDWQLKSLAK